MKEKPFIFSPQMLQAILDGIKTQTRIIINPQPGDHPNDDGYDSSIMARCPYKVGDVLWVRESWCVNDYYDDKSPSELPLGKVPMSTHYMADGPKPYWAGRLRSQYHMPREASRLWLEVISVRMERVQDISADDARKEGYKNAAYAQDEWVLCWFSDFWRFTNSNKSWNENQWVWVVEFKRIQKP